MKKNLLAAALLAAGVSASAATIEQVKTQAAGGYENLTFAPPQADGPKSGAKEELEDLAERAKRIEGIHSEPAIEPKWIPGFVRDIPSFRLVEGPTADKENFRQRLWRVPAAPFVAPIGGAIDSAKQWSKVAWDGGDTVGAIGAGILGGLFGFLTGLVVGVVGAVVNAVMAVRDLVKGKF